jgi:hypothetical protein
MVNQDMQNLIPNFTYRLANASNRYAACIELEGEEIHKITNLDEFYKAFGYTQNINCAGILPDEFIWAEYINNALVNSAACMKIRIIEYLIKHSDIFRQKYSNQYESWFADHAKEVVARGIECAACRIGSFCKSRK